MAWFNNLMTLFLVATPFAGVHFFKDPTELYKKVNNVIWNYLNQEEFSGGVIEQMAELLNPNHPLDVKIETPEDSAAATAASTAAAIASAATAVAVKLSDQFTNVKISKRDLDEAERLIRGELVEKWKESLDYDLTAGIPVEHLGDFVLVLKKKFSLDDEVCNELKSMANDKSKDRLVFEVKHEAESESMHGYIHMTKDSDNTISCVYAFHNLNFKLADRRIETRTQKYFWFFPIGDPEVQIDYEPVTVTNDIQAAKDAYMSYKALEALQSEGIVQEITFVE